MANDPYVKRLFWFVFAGSRGGLNRLRIISHLKDNPSNINQLTAKMSLDYKGVQHHIRVLEKNNMVTKAGERYAVTYFVSTFLDVNMESFEEVKAKLDKST